MTDVVDDMFTIAGRRGNGVATIRSTVLRPANASTGAITPDDHRFDIVAGRLEMRNLDPGPAELHIRMDTWVMPWKKVSIPVSTTPVTLRTLIEDYIEYEPGVVSQTRANADLAEASAVRSESAAARAEGSEQYVQGVIDDGAAAVRAEVQSNADAAVTAASNAATSRSGAETARTDAANSKTAAAGSATAASDSATTAGQHKAAAESAATTAGQHRSAAETAATTAGQHRAAAETARAGAESAADTAAIDAASIVADNLAATVAADRAAAQSAETAATSSATLAGQHRNDAEAFAAAADASAQASETSRLAAEQAASNAQQGIPAGGWARGQLEQSVQDDLQRARTAMQELPVATSQAPGGVRLAGDLTGTASEPRVASGAIKTAHVEDAAITRQKLANDVTTSIDGKLNKLGDAAGLWVGTSAALPGTGTFGVVYVVM
ncbi:hypothetical protein GS885_25725 [Rhodococcus hoagii]|nr:hypothetical protein [Prescottella equi]NKR90374.1 hypothetical protein [Prescottella equi]NKT37185.1 hypothetical protein [Prescottella equi]NKT40048.1 hypothetical protein [Prescottella equi]NKT56913.1 hypothetical protein [Prescottella equi]